jgi:dTDP-4-dehydrorhamnose 3,5-epimerase
MQVMQRYFDHGGADAVQLINTPCYADARGFFFENWHAKRFTQVTGVTQPLVQDNVSWSQPHVLRGLHGQLQQPQGKLITVLSGSIFDVVVDVRPASRFFGQWKSLILTAPHEQNTVQQLWIPPGFAHGFYVQTGPALVHYKTSQYYDPATEFCLDWRSPQLAIDWPLQGQAPIVSRKDQAGLRWDALQQLLIAHTNR